jgi:aconitate hydratase
MFQEAQYADVFGRRKVAGDQVTDRRGLRLGATSTYIQNPPYFDGMTEAAAGRSGHHRRRVLALLGDSITTDHISPAGSTSPRAARPAST